MVVSDETRFLAVGVGVAPDELPPSTRTLVQAVEGFCEGLRLTTAQRRFIEARLLYLSDADCARGIGISPDTPRQWRTEPDFKVASDRQRAFSYAPYVVPLVEDMIGPIMAGMARLIGSEDEKSVAKGIEMGLRVLDVWQPRGRSTSDPETTAAIKAFTAMVERVGRVNQPAAAAPGVIEGQIVAAEPVAAPSEATETGNTSP